MTMTWAIREREETLTRHHLILRRRHYNKRNKREFDRATIRQVVDPSTYSNEILTS